MIWALSPSARLAFYYSIVHDGIHNGEWNGMGETEKHT